MAGHENQAPLWSVVGCGGAVDLDTADGRQGRGPMFSAEQQALIEDDLAFHGVERDPFAENHADEKRNADCSGKQVYPDCGRLVPDHEKVHSDRKPDQHRCHEECACLPATDHQARGRFFDYIHGPSLFGATVRGRRERSRCAKAMFLI
ncbi:hypothetical protein Ga0080574_TMP728 [Salipiger abyssi]|uniref:Uncharacterized protein n=1 Tax=Salipiger abyssi TaxID=1250539 RepID=A0A1P8UNT8_9RHOB|nr:hypothetical protein Ga0080574_TMP728 [Salipiger abyssi]